VKTAPDKGGKEKIEEYEKIIAFHDLVISGKHPTINPTPEQVSHVSHTIVSDSSMGWDSNMFNRHASLQIARAGGLPPLGGAAIATSSTTAILSHPLPQLSQLSIKTEAPTPPAAFAAVITSPPMMTPRSSYRPCVPIPTGPRADINNARAKATPQHSAAFQTTVSSLVQPAQQPKSSKAARK
jgi:hypothetical protein